MSRITISFLSVFIMGVLGCKIHTKVNNQSSLKVEKIPKIKIISDDWGVGDPKDIHAVLKSAAEVIFPLGGQPDYEPILVRRSENGPMVLYRRGQKGQYLVNLDTQDRYWCQYAFQFSHEIGHILCGYRDGDSTNLWFEETLAEVTSLYVLRKLEDKWKDSPPYPEWTKYAPEFSKYAEKRIELYEKQTPKDLKNWIKIYEKDLKENPTNRPRNVGLAIRLLPIFENDPNAWSACMHLNDSKSKEVIPFQQYLNRWHNACNQIAQKEVVKKIAMEFDIELFKGL